MPVKFGRLSSMYGSRNRYRETKLIEVEKPKKVKTKRMVCSYCKKQIKYDFVYFEGNLMHRKCKKEIEDI